MLKKTSLLVLCGVAVALAAIPLISLEKTPKVLSQEEGSLSKDDLAKLSKTFGNYLGKTLVSPAIGVPFDIDSLVEGIKDGAAGRPAPLDEQEYEQMLLSVQANYLKVMADKNLADAEKYLEDNAKKEGVKSLENGKLEYKILKEGNGPAAKEDSEVELNYSGKFIDGTEFGSSEQSGPITITLDQTVPGFRKGLVGMKQGEKRELVIHPDLGYGTSGELPPNSLLIFDIELLKVNPASDKAPEELKEEKERKEVEITYNNFEYNPEYEQERVSSPQLLREDYEIMEDDIYQNRNYPARPRPAPTGHGTNPSGTEGTYNHPYTPFSGNTNVPFSGSSNAQTPFSGNSYTPFGGSSSTPSSSSYPRD